MNRLDHKVVLVTGVSKGIGAAVAKQVANGGSIINFSSLVDRLRLPTYGTYVATKAAVEQLTRVFAEEMGARSDG